MQHDVIPCSLHSRRSVPRDLVERSSIPNLPASWGRSVIGLLPPHHQANGHVSWAGLLLACPLQTDQPPRFSGGAAKRISTPTGFPSTAQGSPPCRWFAAFSSLVFRCLPLAKRSFRRVLALPRTLSERVAQ